MSANAQLPAHSSKTHNTQSSRPECRVPGIQATPLFILLWTLLESVVWNYELRREQLISRGTFLTIKQFPGD